MNPSAVSAEPQPEIPIWHPGVCTVYNSGLVTRPDVQSGQYGLESDITYNQLAVAATRSIRDQEAEGKPNIITDILPNLRPDYNVTLANNILTPTTLTQVSWGLLNFAGENMEGPFYSFYPSSLPGLGALNHIEANADFSAGNTNAYADTRCGPQEHQNQNPLLGFLNWGQRRFHDVVKREFGSPAEYATSLGLNLSGKPYFPAEDTTSFFKRFRSNSPVAQVPSCQAGGCKADLRLAKHYHRRHKVCEFHSKAASVMIGGQTHRFCQQCSRFHALSEFDEGKRSCRKRLADHNRRRRKPQPTSTSASDNPTTNQSAVEKNGELEENDNKQASGGTSDTKSTASPATAKIENLTSVSVASSAPTTSQKVTKQQTFTVDDYQKKEITSKDVFQKSGASNLSPSTSVEAKGNYPQPSAGECNIRPISWLKGASSTSKSIDTVSRSILNDNGNPSRPLLPPLSLYTTQNLLPISARKEPMVKPSQWIVEDTASAESYAPFTNHQDVHASTEIRDGELNTLDSQDFKAVQRIKNDQSVQISLGYPQGQRETKAGPTTGNEQVRDSARNQSIARPGELHLNAVKDISGFLNK